MNLVPTGFESFWRRIQHCITRRACRTSWIADRYEPFAARSPITVPGTTSIGRRRSNIDAKTGSLDGNPATAPGNTRTAREIAVLRGHDNLVLSATFSPDGFRIVTASYDRTARI